MKRYFLQLGRDVPEYCSLAIDATDDADAIAQARALVYDDHDDWDGDPEWATNYRIVQLRDDTRTVIEGEPVGGPRETPADVAPWFIVDNVEGAAIGYRAIVDADDYVICNPSPMGADNARLIAMAPAMLAALQRLTHPMADNTDADFALDVIRRAKGE